MVDLWKIFEMETEKNCFYCGKSFEGKGGICSECQNIRKINSKNNSDSWYKNPISQILIIVFFFVFLIRILFLITQPQHHTIYDDEIKNSKDNYQTSQTSSIHRCGRTWNGKPDPIYGQYGDYCCEACYLENLDRDATQYNYDDDTQIKTVYPEYNK